MSAIEVDSIETNKRDAESVPSTEPEPKRRKVEAGDGDGNEKLLWNAEAKDADAVKRRTGRVNIKELRWEDLLFNHGNNSSQYGGNPYIGLWGKDGDGKKIPLDLLAPKGVFRLHPLWPVNKNQSGGWTMTVCVRDKELSDYICGEFRDKFIQFLIDEKYINSDMDADEYTVMFTKGREYTKKDGSKGHSDSFFRINIDPTCTVVRRMKNGKPVRLSVADLTSTLEASMKYTTDCKGIPTDERPDMPDECLHNVDVDAMFFRYRCQRFYGAPLKTQYMKFARNAEEKANAEALRGWDKMSSSRDVSNIVLGNRFVFTKREGAGGGEDGDGGNSLVANNGDEDDEEMAAYLATCQ